MHKAFEVHMLNETGKAKAHGLAQVFDATLESVVRLTGSGAVAFHPGGRELALVTTHLELASIYAKKAMAQLPENQAALEAIGSRAERMFNAYNEQGPNPWKTFDGRDVPRWNELNDQVRAKWISAAEASQR
jgi:hypothetical protein